MYIFRNEMLHLFLAHIQGECNYNEWSNYATEWRKKMSGIYIILYKQNYQNVESWIGLGGSTMLHYIINYIILYSVVWQTGKTITKDA